MTVFTALDVFRAPLDGINLIEASAGTGKTWTICGLYLRLLLEQARTVDRVLVVTFTNAATAELRDRIRRRLVETLRHLRDPAGGPPASDPFTADLLTHLEVELGLERADLIARLELALETFDEAAIHTIHGFCQRALAEIPFAAGLPFQVELVTDDAQLIQQAANDFWRRHVAVAGGSEAAVTRELAAALANAKDNPEKYAQLLRRALAKPLAPRLWPDDLDRAPAPDAASLTDAYVRARAMWAAEAEAIDQLLASALGQLNGNSYNPSRLAKCRDAWEGWFASADAMAYSAVMASSEAELYRQGVLLLRTKKNCTTPRHRFFEAADKLLNACSDYGAALRAARLRLLRRLVEQVPEELRRRKRQDRVVAFDDMLFNLHQALVSGEFPWLADALRRRFPVALIDEFQDTDPLQFDIFRGLYAAGEAGAGPLFMVGDPKQAIYGFRNADLHTYLGAQSLASGRYTLGENQRSVGGLIAGCNALFGMNPRAFLLDGIDYRPVRRGRKPVPELADASATPRAPLQVWLLPRDEEGAWMTRAGAFEQSGLTVAAEIARLLADGRAGRLTIDGRSVRSGDIAVLVRSHKQGRQMRQALAAWGVGSVELSQASVFQTAEAEELERLLMAIAEPANERLARAALATELLGNDAAALAAMNSDEATFFEYLQRFSDYRSLWDQRGFPMMFRKLLREEGVQQRLLGLERGERRLTDLLHLAELLAEAAAEHASVDSLLRWLGANRRERSGADAAQLRLESDRNLVQIVTIHKAKGLEYPIVFCPFLWDGYSRLSSDTPDLIEYHEPSGSAVLDFRPDSRSDDALKALRKRESAAETVRMIYVAMTRAVHRCYLIAGCYAASSQGRSGFKESTHSMLNWLICGAGCAPEQWADSKKDPAEIEATWLGLAEKQAGYCRVDVLPDLSGQPSLGGEPERMRLSARPAPGSRVPSWNRSSFSSLIRNLSPEVTVADHDVGVEVEELPDREIHDVPASHDILAFPRGAAAGECIHHLFEHVDFSDPGGWEAAIGAALAAHPQGTATVDSEILRAQLNGMLHDVLRTDLGQGFSLGGIGLPQRLTELAFTLPARGLRPDTLNRFLIDHDYPVGRLDFETVSGYLSGAIDLVFVQGGRYYLLDWKSNHLGATMDDYAPARLSQAMTEHAYRLQYLIYAVALQRLLRRRVPDYDHERHFGGVYYLFVRGVRPAWRTAQGAAGVFYDRPSAASLDVLDALIGRHETDHLA
ncbi:exodeoxyribonuclease V subunit beta [Methylolobus aquaticus]|nr:exodeoxyribonuclease V subunit beta [Methylolobus aquaticus]